MIINFTKKALNQFANQLQYLKDQSALKAAYDLNNRVTSFIEHHMVYFPATGRYISQKDMWEIWIPRTKIVLWYRFNDKTLTIIALWHSSQKR